MNMYQKYFPSLEDVDIDDERLEIISDIFEFGDKRKDLKLDFPQKCRDYLLENDSLPMAMYNALVNIYYKFEMDK